MNVYEVLRHCDEFLSDWPEAAALQRQVQRALLQTRASKRYRGVAETDVAEQVATDHKIARSEIFSPLKRRDVVIARCDLWNRLRDLGYSYPAIGRYTGHHHASVIYGVRQWNEVWKPRRNR